LRMYSHTQERNSSDYISDQSKWHRPMLAWRHLILYD
jgi:hypothetical protein